MSISFVTMIKKEANGSEITANVHPAEVDNYKAGGYEIKQAAHSEKKEASPSMPKKHGKRN